MSIKYIEILSQKFEGKKTIEALALMQHYGVPTRILDLTTNALVALYFACLGNNDKDGEVLVFGIPEELVCYSDSDRVTVLANLAKCEKDFYYKKGLLSIYENWLSQVNNKIKEKENKIGEIIAQNFTYYKEKNFYIGKFSDFINENDENITEKILLQEQEFNLDEIITELINENRSENEKIFLERDVLEKIKEKIKFGINEAIKFLNEKYFGKLLHNIREDKTYFQPIINPNDIRSVFAVLPKLDNPRIIRQQGAFLIFGVKEKPMFSITETSQKIKEKVEVDKEWILKGKKEVSDRIIIDKTSKDVIRYELEKLGISNWTLFPEIDKVADDIRKNYQ